MPKSNLFPSVDEDIPDFFRAQIARMFWARVEKGDSCWIWKGPKDRDGYGRMKIGTLLLTHRLAWLLERGAIPKGMCVCHRCDSRACVNPDHLWLGTHAQNMEDMSRKSRGRGKLTNADAAAIKRRVINGESKAQLAREFGVRVQAIYEVVKGEGRYKWIEPADSVEQAYA